MKKFLLTAVLVLSPLAGFAQSTVGIQPLFGKLLVTEDFFVALTQAKAKLNPRQTLSIKSLTDDENERLIVTLQKGCEGWPPACANSAIGAIEANIVRNPEAGTSFSDVRFVDYSK